MKIDIIVLTGILLVILIIVVALLTCKCDSECEHFGDSFVNKMRGDGMDFRLSGDDVNKFVACVKIPNEKKALQCARDVLLPKSVPIGHTIPTQIQPNTIQPNATLPRPDPVSKKYVYAVAQGDCIEHGHPETVYTNLTYGKCRDKCSLDDTCSGISFGWKDKRCVLKAGGPIPKTSCGNKNGYTHFWKQQRHNNSHQTPDVSHQKHIFVEADGDCVANGHPETVFLGVAGSDCREKCDVAESCAGYSYNPSVERCVLKAGGPMPKTSCGNKNGYTHFWKHDGYALPSDHASVESQYSGHVVPKLAIHSNHSNHSAHLNNLHPATHAAHHSTTSLPAYIKADGDCVAANNHPETVFLDVAHPECRNKCTEASSCAGYSYDPNVKRCVLKAGGPMPKTSCGNKNGYTHFWKQQKSIDNVVPVYTTADGDCIAPNHPEKAFLNMSDSDCKAKCTNERSCAGYSYNPADKRCVLKAGGQIPKTNCGNKNGYTHFWKNIAH